MLLANSKGSVYQTPSGTIKVPPPRLINTSTACLKAPALSVLPSLIAPKSLRLTLPLGIIG